MSTEVDKYSDVSAILPIKHMHSQCTDGQDILIFLLGRLEETFMENIEEKKKFSVQGFRSKLSSKFKC